MSAQSNLNALVSKHKTLNEAGFFSFATPSPAENKVPSNVYTNGTKNNYESVSPSTVLGKSRYKGFEE